MMFPFVDGFDWSLGHILFLSIFGSVLALIGLAVIMSLSRSAQAVRAGESDSIRWNSEFHDLSKEELHCRHELAGRVPHRLCGNGFDCRSCEMHQKLSKAEAADVFDPSEYGLDYPSDRLYHRGQTWIKREADGTITVGLTDLGRRLLGYPDKVGLPAVGQRVHANGSGWTITRNWADVRVLAPIDGEVLETGGPDHGFYLRLRPIEENPNLSHLLTGAEVRGWVRVQLERLQILVTPLGARASLADGGVLMDDLPCAQPEADWDKIYGELFLEP